MTFSFEKGRYVVGTDNGPVRGFEKNNLLFFCGIPYAKAARFHAPEAPEPWTRPLDASTYGGVCPLLDHDLPRRQNMNPNRFWIENENCQNLNVITPGADGQKRPVIVWLHGGAYSFGSSISALATDGENIVRKGNVVHVGLNHRLNILGFFDVSGYGSAYESSANAGLMDIIFALKWVRKNIEAFGGDPDDVTLVGQSGGGGKILALMQMKEADGLYKKVVISSGNLYKLQPEENSSSVPLVEKVLACAGITSIQELEILPYSVFAAAYKKAVKELNGKGHYMGCRPKKDAHYPGDVFNYGFRDETKDIPVLIGNCFGEFDSMIPLFADKGEIFEKLFAQAYPDRQVSELDKRDSQFRCGTIRYLKAAMETGRKLYNYQFEADYRYEGITPAWHCADLPFLFANCGIIPITDCVDNAAYLEEEMSGMFLRMVKQGGPGFQSCGDRIYTRVFDRNGARTEKDYAVALDEALWDFSRQFS